jgi:CheY-like chemotaxis protein
MDPLERKPVTYLRCPTALIEEFMSNAMQSDPSIAERFGSPPAKGLSNNVRILLAEDCEDTRLLLTYLLQGMGAEVETVDDGLSCIEKAMEAWRGETPYDVILVDIRMPVLDGFGAARALRDKGYEAPMVAITGEPSLGVKFECIHAGFDHFLAKCALAETIVPTLKIFLKD